MHIEVATSLNSSIGEVILVKQSNTSSLLRNTLDPACSSVLQSDARHFPSGAHK